MHVALPVFMVTEIYGAKPYCSQLINIRKKNMINHCTYVPVHEGNWKFIIVNFMLLVSFILLHLLYQPTNALNEVLE